MQHARSKALFWCMTREAPLSLHAQGSALSRLNRQTPLLHGWCTSPTEHPTPQVDVLTADGGAPAAADPARHQRAVLLLELLTRVSCGIVGVQIHGG